MFKHSHNIVPYIVFTLYEHKHCQTLTMSYNTQYRKPYNVYIITLSIYPHCPIIDIVKIYFKSFVRFQPISDILYYEQQQNTLPNCF